MPTIETTIYNSLPLLLRKKLCEFLCVKAMYAIFNISIIKTTEQEINFLL